MVSVVPCTLSVMPRAITIAICLMLFASALLAQTSTPPTATTAATAKTKKSKPERAVATEFSENVAKNILGQLRDALQGHSPRRMLAVMDRERLDGYLSLEDRTYAFFNRYESFRVLYRILQTSTENDRGVALVDWQIELAPNSGPPERREAQVRFEFAAGKNGWQIVDFRPREFFQ